MSYDTRHRLKTGGDPRTLKDYAALRDELNKLTHPARPDINWTYAERLCLSLFEHNGIELQTAAWYTLARTQLAGLYGLNEGLAILEALITRQWGSLWPQPVHARMEILSGLSKRLQQTMRTLTLTYADLSPLYLAEQHLENLGDVLQRLELKHLSQLDVLKAVIHNAAVRLENSDGATDGRGEKSANTLPAGVNDTALMAASAREQTDKTRWIYVAQPEPPSDITTTEPPPSQRVWKPFLGGALSMLVVGSAALWGWQYIHRPDPLLVQLNASLAPQPVVLTPAQLQALQSHPPSAETAIRATQHQLTRLTQLPAGWNITYGNQLVQQVLVLWPEQSASLRQQWQQQLDAIALPSESLTGWHQGMEQLQRLTDRLNGLDEQHGKYMTVSELKSQVFALTQSFSQTPPVEEQLRQMQQSGVSPARAQQAQMHLNQLLTRYTLLTDKPGNTTP
ncbi:VasL domain-containing protein [Lelliottia amnigena]